MPRATFIFVLLISIFMTMGVVALFFRGKRWHEYVTAYLSIFTLVFVLTVVIFNQVANYPVFLIEDVFQFP